MVADIDPHVICITESGANNDIVDAELALTGYAIFRNKTATECWTCLKYEIEGIPAKFVPLRKQWIRSRKKHLSKVAIRKIAHKQMLWGIYKHTGNVEDYKLQRGT